MLLLLLLTPSDFDDQQWLISVKVNRDIKSLRSLSKFTNALNRISRLTRSRTSPGLKSFKINSPPVFEILTDPSWIAVFITVVQGLNADRIKTILKRILGISDLEREQIFFQAMQILNSKDPTVLSLVEKIVKDLGGSEFTIKVEAKVNKRKSKESKVKKKKSKVKKNGNKKKNM